MDIIYQDEVSPSDPVIIDDEYYQLPTQTTTPSSYDTRHITRDEYRQVIDKRLQPQASMKSRKRIKVRKPIDVATFASHDDYLTAKRKR